MHNWESPSHWVFLWVHHLFHGGFGLSNHSWTRTHFRFDSNLNLVDWSIAWGNFNGDIQHIQSYGFSWKLLTFPHTIHCFVAGLSWMNKWCSFDILMFMFMHACIPCNLPCKYLQIFKFIHRRVDPFQQKRQHQESRWGRTGRICFCANRSCLRQELLLTQVNGAIAWWHVWSEVYERSARKCLGSEIFMLGIKSKACKTRNLGTSETPRSAPIFVFTRSAPRCISALRDLDPKSISKKSWRKHGGNIPRFRSCWKRPIFTENSWDYWDHGPIQRKMLELREKVPLKSSEEKCCVLQWRISGGSSPWSDKKIGSCCIFIDVILC